MLRLDMIGALGVGDNKMPKTLYTAHLLPRQKIEKADKHGQMAKVFEISDPIEWHLYDVNVEEFLPMTEWCGKAVARDYGIKKDKIFQAKEKFLAPLLRVVQNY